MLYLMPFYLLLLFFLQHKWRKIVENILFRTNSLFFQNSPSSSVEHWTGNSNNQHPFLDRQAVIRIRWWYGQIIIIYELNSSIKTLPGNVKCWVGKKKNKKKKAKLKIKIELSAHNIYLELNFKSQQALNMKVRKTFGHLEAKQKYQHSSITLSIGKTLSN